MNEEQRNALQANLHHICRDLNAEDVLPYLCAKGIVREGQAEEILKIFRKSTRNMQLINIVKAAGPLAFQEFINALQFCNKKYLAEIILAHLSLITQQLTLLELKNQAPSTSTSTMSQSNTTDWDKVLENAQQSLKEMYLTRFKKVYPFSLPFTFDIENTWVSLALKEYNKELDAPSYFTHRPQRPLRALEDEMKNSQATENHAELLERAFSTAKMLLIEGDPATGKTSLMRRLAYEWANEKQELLHYDLILYAEFREAREKKFQGIADLVLGGLERYLTKEDYENLQKLMNNVHFCKGYRILVLLDGYDESSLEKQCSELTAYMKKKTIDKQLLFDTVITTRKGYLSNLKGLEGRFVFAEVLGFTTKQQKEKYVYNHFLSSEVDCQHNIAAVHNLLNSNENLDKLAETPLFLTFICMVHERIIDGTLLELYCNIIRWLIDRHQQDFPDRDIPALFEFRSKFEQAFEPLNVRQKQTIIQKHYLQFPQFLSLGKMALNNLKKNIFQDADFSQFIIKSIVHQVGLIRGDKFYDQSWNLTTTYSFPHRTIQEFLAAFYCFCSNDPTNEWLLPDSKLNTSERSDFNPSGMNEFERFLLRFALSDKMPIQAEKRKYYFERITYIKLDIIFDAFNATASFNNKLLNWFLSQCTNVQNIVLHGELNRRYARNMLNDAYIHNESTITSMFSPLFSFKDLIKLHALTFGGDRSGCTFSDNSQLSFTNCPSLTNLSFNRCEMKSSTIVGIATLPAIHTVEFWLCKIDLATWQSITDQISNSNVKYLELTFGAEFNKEFLVHLQQCSNIEQMDITIQYYAIRQNDLLSFSHLIKLHSLTFGGDRSGCTFSANSQLAFTNFPTLTNLTFRGCKMESSTNLGIATLPAIDTVKIDQCEIDMTTWQSITDQISNSNVKYLQLTFPKEDFNSEFLIPLQQCNNIEQMDITIQDFTIHQNDLLSFSDLIKFHSLSFLTCTFSASSQLSFTNCPSLKNLKFERCAMKSNTIVGIATLPAIDTVEFYKCNIDMTTSQSITDQINNSNVKYLKLTFRKDFNKEFLIHLQQCNNIEQMDITVLDYSARQNDLLSFDALIKLHSLTFLICTFSADCQLSFTNCPSVKILIFFLCEMKNSTNLGFATLPAIDIVEFWGCTIDLATWQSITGQISSSDVKYLYLTFGKDFKAEFLIHLQQCNNVAQIEIAIEGYRILQNDLLSFSHLINLHSLTFEYRCTFSANSQLSFTNCPSLKNLILRKCEMKSSTFVGIATLPAIDTVQFCQCSIDMSTWQSITDQISNSNVTCLHLSADFFVEETYPEYLHHLQKCERIQQITVNDVKDDDFYILNRNEESVTANLALTAQKLPTLTSVTISDHNGRSLDESRRLSERNRELIEKAGQQRDPHFSITYVES